MIEPTEDMKGVYYTPSEKNLSAEDMIDDFIADCERKQQNLRLQLTIT